MNKPVTPLAHEIYSSRCVVLCCHRLWNPHLWLLQEFPKSRWLMVKKLSGLHNPSMISVLGQLEMNCLDVDSSCSLNDSEEWKFSQWVELEEISILVHFTWKQRLIDLWTVVTACLYWKGSGISKIRKLVRTSFREGKCKWNFIMIHNHCWRVICSISGPIMWNYSCSR